MRNKNNSMALFVLLACLVNGVCAITRDVSATANYKPWIGKTVRLTLQRSCNVFAPTWGPYFIDWAATYNNYPIIAKVPERYPVVIEAVKRTEGRYLMGNLPYVHDQLVLSMEHPSQTNKRITVWSEINFVEPFKDRHGYKVDFIQSR